MSSLVAESFFPSLHLDIDVNLCQALGGGGIKAGSEALRVKVNTLKSGQVQTCSKSESTISASVTVSVMVTNKL